MRMTMMTGGGGDGNDKRVQLWTNTADQCLLTDGDDRQHQSHLCTFGTWHSGVYWWGWEQKRALASATTSCTAE